MEHLGSGDPERMETVKDGKKCYEMVSSGYDLDVLMNSPQLWPSVHHQVSQHSSMAHAPSLAKELLAGVGYWGKDSQFSLGVWPLEDCPCSSG